MSSKKDTSARTRGEGPPGRPAYRPPRPALVAQPKAAATAQKVLRPNAPPAYRPQQTPRVLQTKASGVKAADSKAAAVRLPGTEFNRARPTPPPAPKLPRPPTQPALPKAAQPAPVAQLKPVQPPKAAQPPRPSAPAERTNVSNCPPPKLPPRPPHVASLIQAKPAGQGGVIQPVKLYQQTKPKNARGTVSYYSKGATNYATDGSSHWYFNRFGTWTRLKKGKVPTYNRFKGQTMGRGGERKASFKSRMGSGATYSDKLHRRRILKTSALAQITSMKRGKRTYTKKMRDATALEGRITTSSATQYAAHFGAPVIPGGYNWCHLHGHGGGGSDNASNIVAASTHCNSEQLEIEKIVYQYRNSDVRLKVEAERYKDAAHLASRIVCYVFVGSELVYTRAIDAFRTSKPSWIELEAVKINLTKAITDKLK